MDLVQIRQSIIDDPDNAEFKDKGWLPLYTASKKSKIAVVGQAPGIKAQESMIPWEDKSGDRLKRWLGIDNKTFHNSDIISLLPMDFYYPGKGKTGDLPPRKGVAEKWHPKILKQMPEVKLIVLVGQYSQKYYLGKDIQKNLTETVRNYKDYLPRYFPVVHSSPLNFRWHTKNPWFEEDVVPELQEFIRLILES